MDGIYIDTNVVKERKTESKTIDNENLTGLFKEEYDVVEPEDYEKNLFLGDTTKKDYSNQTNTLFVSDIKYPEQQDTLTATRIIIYILTIIIVVQLVYVVYKILSKLRERKNDKNNNKNK